MVRIVIGGWMAFADQDWKKAKKLCRLNEEDIRIAKEMGYAISIASKDVKGYPYSQGDGAQSQESYQKHSQ
jgi:hypothetical protein